MILTELMIDVLVLVLEGSGGFLCWGGEGATIGQKDTEIGPEKGPNFVTAGAPGRGVLRFLPGGYSRPVHNLPFFVIFTKNVQT